MLKARERKARREVNMATKKSGSSNDVSKKSVRKIVIDNTEPVVEKTIFELMAEKRPAKETIVDTPAGSVSVKNRIPFSEMIMIINTVVDMCTDSDTGEVKWEMMNYALKMAVCSSYCNVAVPKNVEVAYSAVCGEDGLYEIIKEYIDADQLGNISDSIFDKLKAREDLNNSTAVGKLKELIESVDGLMKAVSDASEGFDPETVAGALGSLSLLTGK